MPRSSTPPAAPAVLADQVVRYWLTLLRHEEALGRRPKVRQHEDRTMAEVNLADPVPGQEYAKVPFGAASVFLTRQTQELRLDLGSEWLAFFEDWLLARYRRGDDEDEAGSHLVSFPTVHLARDELAGVLRFPVELRWRGEKGPFSAPTRSERRRRCFPPPPSEITLVCPQPSHESEDDFEDAPEDEAESELPYFIDTRLLRDTLRIDVERIDALFSELKKRSPVEPRDVIVAVARLIENQSRLEAGGSIEDTTSRGGPPMAIADPRALLSRLLGAVAARLEQVQARAKAYGVALVLRADSSRTTWHLQKDMEAALMLNGRGALESLAPVLEAYLTGRRLNMSEATCWGRWRGPTLTSSQREAAERTLGSQLCAVQGPPGTGKTTLILSLAAHALVKRIDALARGDGMGTGLTVITSTNNRAVDNAIDPLSTALDCSCLPLSLRVGSRQVIDQVTREQLGRARRWLESSTATREQVEVRLAKELLRFRELRDKLDASLEPLQTYRAAQRKRATLERELAQQGHGSAPLSALRRAVQKEPSPADTGLPSRPAVRRRALRLLRDLADRLIDGSALTEMRGKKVLRRVRRHFKRTEELYFAQVQDALGKPLPPHVPPKPEPNDAEAALDAWEEGFEALIGEVMVLISALEQASRIGEQQKRIEKTKAELAALDAVLGQPPPIPTAEQRAHLEAQHQSLFEAAVRVREAWARAHRDELLAALGRVARVAETARSLKGFIESDKEAKHWLLRLFPVWGTTLLSMGNVFPPEAGSLDTVIIDEAGQCHPAYALSALLRAKRALVIGDTFQLEPVFEMREADEKRIRRTLSLRVAPDTLEPYRCFEGSTASAQRLADSAVEYRPILVDHFRCQPQIASISERLCGYGLITHTPYRSRSAEAPFLTAPLLHLAVEGQQQRFAGSWMNEAELGHAVALVHHLLACGIGASEIGVITPYRGQLERLWRVFRDARLPVERLWSDGEDAHAPQSGLSSAPGLALGTVHRFQGGERSIMLFSTTLTRRDALSFVDGRVNLVNVAASRAKEHLVTIGHTPTLRLGQNTRHLVEEAEALVLDGG